MTIAVHHAVLKDTTGEYLNEANYFCFRFVLKNLPSLASFLTLTLKSSVERKFNVFDFVP